MSKCPLGAAGAGAQHAGGIAGKRNPYFCQCLTSEALQYRWRNRSMRPPIMAKLPFKYFSFFSVGRCWGKCSFRSDFLKGLKSSLHCKEKKKVSVSIQRFKSGPQEFLFTKKAKWLAGKAVKEHYGWSVSVWMQGS